MWASDVIVTKTPIPPLALWLCSVSVFVLLNRQSTLKKHDRQQAVHSTPAGINFVTEFMADKIVYFDNLRDAAFYSVFSWHLLAAYSTTQAPCGSLLIAVFVKHYILFEYISATFPVEKKSYHMH